MHTLFSIDYLKKAGYTSTHKHHFHEGYEIYYLLSGHRLFFIKDRTYHIEKGDLVFINKYDLHKSSGAEGNKNIFHERFVLHFDDSFMVEEDTAPPYPLLNPFHIESNVLRLKNHEQGFIESLLYNVFQEFEQNQSGNELYINALMTQLLIFSNRLIEKADNETNEYSNPMTDKIYQIAEYININFMNPLSLTTVAQQYYLSTGHLSRVFKQITGFSFVEYITSVRIKEAQKLLRESDLKIIDIAEKVGYENISHFGRVYKQVTKMSPLEYRKLAIFRGND